MCAEAKTNRYSLVSSNLNPIEQLWDELWRRILDRSVQPWNLRQLQVALHLEWARVAKNVVQSYVLSIDLVMQLLLQERVMLVIGRI